MNLSPLDPSLWSSPAGIGRVCPTPNDRCVLSLHTVDPVAGVEFATKLDPVVLPWNDHSPLHYSLEPNSQILFCVSNPTSEVCAVHVVLTDAGDLSKRVVSEAREIAPGDVAWFEPSSFAQKAQDSDGFNVVTNSPKKPQPKKEQSPEGSPADKDQFPRNLYNGVLVTAYVRVSPRPNHPEPSSLGGGICESWDPVRWLATCFGFPAPAIAAPADKTVVAQASGVHYKLEASLKVYAGDDLRRLRC